MIAKQLKLKNSGRLMSDGACLAVRRNKYAVKFCKLYYETKCFP